MSVSTQKHVNKYVRFYVHAHHKFSPNAYIKIRDYNFYFHYNQLCKEVYRKQYSNQINTPIKTFKK